MKLEFHVEWVWGLKEVLNFDDLDDLLDFEDRNIEALHSKRIVEVYNKNDCTADPVYKKGFGKMSDYEMDMYL